MIEAEIAVVRPVQLIVGGLPVYRRRGEEVERGSVLPEDLLVGDLPVIRHREERSAVGTIAHVTAV